MLCVIFRMMFVCIFLFIVIYIYIYVYLHQFIHMFFQQVLHLQMVALLFPNFCRHSPEVADLSDLEKRGDLSQKQ